MFAQGRLRSASNDPFEEMSMLQYLLARQCDTGQKSDTIGKCSQLAHRALKQNGHLRNKMLTCRILEIQLDGGWGGFLAHTPTFATVLQDKLHGLEH